MRGGEEATLVLSRVHNINEGCANSILSTFAEQGMWTCLGRAKPTDGFGARHTVNDVDGVAVTPTSCVTSRRFFPRGLYDKKKASGR